VHVARGRGSVLLWQDDVIPRGRGNFGGCPGPSKASAIRCSRRCRFRCKRIIESPITSCIRSDHSVCQACANRTAGDAAYPPGRGDGNAQHGRTLISTIALFTLCPVTKQYTLIPAKGWWRCVAGSGKVTALAICYWFQRSSHLQAQDLYKMNTQPYSPALVTPLPFYRIKYKQDTSGYAMVVHGRPETPKNTNFGGSPSPQGSYSPYILGDTTRPGHVTCILVWSKSDRRRLRKTLHKQTDKQTNRQTNRQTDRHYENNGHLAVNQYSWYLRVICRTTTTRKLHCYTRRWRSADISLSFVKVHRRQT